jgi:hypothetical protein
VARPMPEAAPVTSTRFPVTDRDSCDNRGLMAGV